MTAGDVIRRARRRHGLSQRRLALRTGTGQSAISRIERDQVSPSVETVVRLMAAMGEELVLDARSRRRNYDPVHARALRGKPPAERLQRGLAWNRFAAQLSEAGRRARHG